jgi:hypothetical protein
MTMTASQRDYLQEHIPYMLKMLRYTHGQMRQDQHYLSWNAHFESFAIHARNLTSFLTNGDKGNVKASDFVEEYREHIGDQSGRMQRLRAQVFHLAKERPKVVIGKFNSDDANEIFEWIEKNFACFLSELNSEQRGLFDESKSHPENDQAQYMILVGGSGVPMACTASPVSAINYR